MVIMNRDRRPAAAGYRLRLWREWRDAFMTSLRSIVAPSLIVALLLISCEWFLGLFGSFAVARTTVLANLATYLSFVGILSAYHIVTAAALLDQARHAALLRVEEQVTRQTGDIEALKTRLTVFEARRPFVIPSGRFTVHVLPKPAGEGLYLRNVGEEPALNVSIKPVGLQSRRAEFTPMNSLAPTDGTVPVSIRYLESDENGMFGVVGLWLFAKAQPYTDEVPGNAHKYLPLEITYTDKHGKLYVDLGYCIHTELGPRPADTQMVIEQRPHNDTRTTHDAPDSALNELLLRSLR
jgi:hypothetical protein